MAIRGRVLTRFPARVVALAGQKIAALNGAYSFGPDFTTATDQTTFADPAKFYALVYSLDAGTHVRARMDRLNVPSTPLVARTFGDENATLVGTDDYIGLTTTLTAQRTWTLPAATAKPQGRPLVIQDEVGGINGANTIKLVPAGTDTIAGATQLVIDVPKGGLVLRSNGTNRWNYAPPLIADNAITNAKLADNAVTNAKLADVATGTIKGRATALTGDPEDLTVAQVRALLSSPPTVQTFSTAGTFTYTRPAGLTYAEVEIIAPGGGSGACAATGAGTIAAAGGGGGGGYSWRRLVPAATESVTVGAPGTAGAAGANNGGSGGTTSFGAWCSATGGGGGGGSSATTIVTTGGGTSGSGSGGDINMTGDSGENGSGQNGSYVHGGKGGAAARGGGGGLGGDGGGGTAGGAYGGGGGAPSSQTSSTARAGTAGGGGVVIVREFYQ